MRMLNIYISDKMQKWKKTIIYKVSHVSMLLSNSLFQLKIGRLCMYPFKFMTDL